LWAMHAELWPTLWGAIDVERQARERSPMLIVLAVEQSSPDVIRGPTRTSSSTQPKRDMDMTKAPHGAEGKVVLCALR
jgi:hypothetical protein